MKKFLLTLALCLLPFETPAQTVRQSGNVTPGHSAAWAAPGVLIDGGVPGGPIFTGSTTLNDFACVGASGTLIDCGLSATGTNAWNGLQNFNGGATAPTRPLGDNTTNVATTAYVTATFGAGPGSTVVGDIVIWNSANGTNTGDSGILGTFKQPVSYPSNITSGHQVCAADSDCQFGNAWSQYPLGSVSANPLIVGKSGSTIGSSTPGQLFTIVFTSTGLTGSPITKTYTAIGGDTVTSIAVGLCALVQADVNLHNAFGQPSFCQSLGGGIFNLQYTSAFSATGATPLTTTTTGSTGTITLHAEVNTLDYVLLQLGRAIPPSRAGVAGDGLYALDFTGQDSTGTFNTHYGQITIAISDPTAGATRGKMIFNTAGGSEFQIDKGIALYDTSGVIASGGTRGLGSINIPAVGKFSIDNIDNIRRSAGSAQFIIEGTGSDSVVVSGNGGVGINVTPVAGTLTSALSTIINLNTAAVSPFAGSTLQLEAADASSTVVDLDSYGAGASGILSVRSARGTGAAPSNLLTNDTIGGIIFRPYTNGAFTTLAAARIDAIFTDSSPNNGTATVFSNTPNGSTTRAESARIHGSGCFSVGTTTNCGLGNILALGTVASGVVAVGSLPTCNTAAKGARHFVTDANATFTAGIGAVVAAGGANNVPVTCDGTSWRIG